MEIDLKSMTRKQLEKHLKDVTKALTNVKARERREARKAAEKAAAEFGFSLDELTDAPAAQGKPVKKQKKAVRKQSPAKFANPADASQTWTGKGRQPNWYRAAIEKGAKPETMAI